MSRSYRKTPVIGRSKAVSEKEDKRIAHQTERAQVRTALKSARDLDELVLSERKQAYYDVCNFAKDGKQYASIRIRIGDSGRAMQALKVPEWLKGDGDRGLHKVLAK